MNKALRTGTAVFMSCADALRRRLRSLLYLGICVALSACGFHLKGTSPLPFDTLYTNISDSSEFGAQLRRAVLAASPGTRFVTDPKDAQAKLIELSNRQSLRDISIDTQGRVEEYELNLVFVFQLTDADNRFLLPPTTLRSSREIPYDPDAVQAKEGEIATIFRNMRQSMVDRIVRRLTSPEVAQAFSNAAVQPIDESPPDPAPLSPEPQEFRR